MELFHVGKFGIFWIKHPPPFLTGSGRVDAVFRVQITDPAPVSTALVLLVC